MTTTQLIRHDLQSISRPSEHPTVWGLTPVQLHDRFWAARGIHIVRPGEPLPDRTEMGLYLLSDNHALAIFRLGRLVETLSWIKPDLLWIRLHDSRDHGYREIAITDREGQFLRFERLYYQSESHVVRFALTADRMIAITWQRAADARQGWRRLREIVPQSDRCAMSITGTAYDRRDDHDVMDFVRDLMRVWRRPDTAISRVRNLHNNVWVDEEADVHPAAQFVGPAWIGAGRTIEENVSVLGPAVLWDRPEMRPPVDDLQLRGIDLPNDSFFQPIRWRKVSQFDRIAKRAFDIVFSLIMLILTLPIYPLVMLAIYLEDGRPFFFLHRRETKGGREFPCLKFRSMRKDSEHLKSRLLELNQADGPQFYIDNDPRLTRVGRVLRKFQIDELPQFVNVLLGHMSVVGPRPSPRKENQYCPAWREARLSVRPGITGLWQVCRTRRAGFDFQEWIKYDIEYVENASWMLDMKIIWKTIVLLLRGK